VAKIREREEEEDKRVCSEKNYMSKTAGAPALRVRIFLMFFTKQRFKDIRKTVPHPRSACQGSERPLGRR